MQKWAELESEDPVLQAYSNEARELLQETEQAFDLRRRQNLAITADYSSLEKIRISQPLSYLLTIDHSQRQKLLDYILRVEVFHNTRGGMERTVRELMD